MIYKIINTILSKNDTELTASEAHGIATGMLCADYKAECGKWIAELFRNVQPVNDEQQSLLSRLFEETRRLLASPGFEFELFLPEDDAPLGEQVEALKRWCQGFLFGVGANSSGTETEWPDDVREIIKDITEFTKLDTKVGGEDDENAFMEITEYLRSVVVLLRDDLKDIKDGLVH